MKRQLLAISLIASPFLVAAEMPESISCYDCECYTPAYYDLQCNWGITLSVDFLYWYGKETGLAYAQKTKTLFYEEKQNGIPTGFGQLILTPYKTEHLKTKWKPGVRGGLGWTSDCDGWDLYFHWTYYSNRSSRSTSVEPFPSDVRAGIEPAFMPPLNAFGLLSPWVNPALIINFNPTSTSLVIWDKVSASWRLHLNSVELELGRKFWLSPCSSMRPYIGLRGGWTETKFSITSSRFTKEGSFIVIPKSVNKFKNCFWGIGFTGGFQPNWYFSKCFSVFGKGDFSLLWGYFDIKRTGKPTWTFTSLNTGETSIDSLRSKSKNNFDSMQGIFDLAIGLRFEDTYCCDQYRFALDLGWEHHIWYDHNHRNRFSQSVLTDNNDQEQAYASFNETYGNLIMGGLVIQARFDF